MASIPSAPSLRYRLRDWSEQVTFTPRQKRIAAIAALSGFGAFWGAAVALAGVNGALLCISFVACIFCLRDFRAGAALLIAIMPISQSYVFPHAMLGITGMNPLNLLLMATLLSYFMRAVGDGTLRDFLPARLFWWYVAPITLGAILGMQNVDRIPGIFRDLELIFFDGPGGYVRDYWGKPLTFVLYALLVAAAVARSRHVERFITPMILSVWVMAALALVFVALSGVSLSELAGTYARHFLSKLGMHANDLGRLYATAFALLLFVWDRTERIALKSGLFLTMGAVGIALLLTFSRGAILGAVIVAMIYLLSRRNAKTIAMAVAALPLALWLMPGALWYRLTIGFGAGANAVTAGRTEEIWEPLLPELFKSPVFGEGLGSILWSNAMIDGRLLQVAHPHNAYLQLFMDLGLVGFVLVLGFWIWAWRQFRVLSRDARLVPEMQGFFEGAAAGLLGFLITGMAGSSFMPVPAQAFLWLAVGVMFGMRVRLRAMQAHATGQS